MTSELVRGIMELRDEVQREMEGMSRLNFENMYMVGRIQGRIEGLREAHQILEQVLKDQE